MLNVGEQNGCVAFLGYRQHPDGSKGPAEINNLIRKIGDIIIAVNGHSTAKKTFKEIIPMLNQRSTYAYLRLVHRERMTDGGLTTSSDWEGTDVGGGAKHDGREEGGAERRQ
jgi:hypothetical protein